MMNIDDVRGLSLDGRRVPKIDPPEHDTGVGRGRTEAHSDRLSSVKSYPFAGRYLLNRPLMAQYPLPSDLNMAALEDKNT
jgi:hypothetical protein